MKTLTMRELRHWPPIAGMSPHSRHVATNFVCHVKMSKYRYKKNQEIDLFDLSDLSIYDIHH